MTSKIVELLSDQHTPNLNIVDRILVNLDVADTFALQATCRGLKWLVRHMTESPYLFNVDKHLCQFSNDPTRFRSELGKCNGLIRGSPAQNFFSVGHNTSSTLSIFINHASTVGEFTKYLQQDEGYEEHKSGKFAVQLFKRDEPFSVSIYVEKTGGPPILNIINRAETTADLTCVSWNKAYCLFPSLTIKRHKFILLEPLDEKMATTLREHAACGWTTRDLLWPGLTPEPLPQEGLHHVGGPGSLIIDLPNSPKGDFTPDYVLENSTFSLAVNTDTNDHHHRHLTIRAGVWGRTMALRHGLVCGKLCPESHSWKKFLGDKLNHWAYMELVKSPPEKRPARFSFRHCYGGDNPEICSNIPTWDYADDQVSIWFEEWKRQNKTSTQLSAPQCKDGKAAYN